MPSDGERTAGASVRASVAFLRPAPAAPEVAREFTPEGCRVDRVRWFDHPRGEWVEDVTLSTD